MASTALLVKTALRDRIVSLMPECEVTYGFPARDPGRKWIHVGKITWEFSEWITNRSKNEEYSILIVLNVNSTGETAESIEAILMTYASRLEDSLLAPPYNLNVSRVISMSLIPKHLQAYPLPDAYEGQYEFELRVSARI